MDRMASQAAEHPAETPLFPVPLPMCVSLALASGSWPSWESSVMGEGGARYGEGTKGGIISLKDSN